MSSPPSKATKPWRICRKIIDCGYQRLWDFEPMSEGKTIKHTTTQSAASLLNPICYGWYMTLHWEGIALVVWNIVWSISSICSPPIHQNPMQRYQSIEIEFIGSWVLMLMKWDIWHFFLSNAAFDPHQNISATQLSKTPRHSQQLKYLTRAVMDDTYLCTEKGLHL